MYQTARMLDIALSRSELAVCMTRFAMRPAKSFWKNGQLWRTTCQWLCQRIRLVAPGTSALCRIETSARIASGRTTSTSATMREQHRHRGRQRGLTVGRLHQRHEAADEQRNDGVEQRDGEARAEHGRVPALRLLDEVPVERDEPFRRRADRRARSHGNVEIDDLHGKCAAQPEPLPRSLRGCRRIADAQHDTRFARRVRLGSASGVSSCRVSRPDAPIAPSRGGSARACVRAE